MNYFNTRKDFYFAEKMENIYTKIVEEKEKLTKEICEKKLQAYTLVLFGESFEENANKEEDI